MGSSSVLKKDSIESLPKISPRQANALVYLVGEIDRKGKAPTYSVLSKDLNVANGAIQGYLEALSKRGYIERPGRHSNKSLLVTELGKKAIQHLNELVEENPYTVSTHTPYLNGSHTGRNYA